MRGRWQPPKGYLTISDAAQILGWSYRRAWRWGLKEKIFHKVDGHWVTSKRRIELAYPDILQEHLV